MSARWPRPLTPQRRRALAREVEEELRTHLAMRAEDNERAGMAPADADADARARFGDVEYITAACLWAEQTHPLREFQRLIVTGLLFAVGFGAFAVAFSLACAVFIRPLRFDDADRLVRVGAGWDDARVPFQHFRAWQAQSESFEHLTSFDASEVVLTVRGTSEPLRVMLVTDDYFKVFGVAPLEGTSRLTEDPDVILISEALWERRFQRSRSVLGTTLLVNEIPHLVAGVMPEAAQLSHRVDLWHQLPAEARTDESLNYIVGLLRPDVTLDAVREEVGGIVPKVPVSRSPIPLLYPLKGLYVAPVHTTAWIALGTSLLILLLIAGLAFRRVLVRARLAAQYGSGEEGFGTQLGMAMIAAVIGLGVAQTTQAVVYDGLLGRWGPLFDRSLDALVVLVVLGVGLAVGAVLVLGQRWGRRMVVRSRILG